jgi:hypothetical protein
MEMQSRDYVEAPRRDIEATTMAISTGSEQ